MSAHALRCGLMLALCGALAAPSFAADIDKNRTKRADETATSAVAPFVATAREVAADPAGVWARFFEKADLDSAYDQYGVLDEIELGEQSADAAQCRAAASKLKTATEAVPVSIAIRRAAMLCADAVGDEAGAEREAAALGALARYALADGAGRRWRPPVRVLSPRDVYALLNVLGYDYRYEIYHDARPDRYFPLEVAAWDDRAKLERHLTFDYVDAAYRIDRGKKYSGQPFLRAILASSFLSGQVESRDVSALDIQAIRDVANADSREARLKILRDAASRGGLQSATALLSACAAEAPPGCADGLVDALLPLAEKRQAYAMTLLAMAYNGGIGIDADPAAATVLLDAADRRWSRHGATFKFAALQMAMGKTLDPLARGRLQRLAAGGNEAAIFMLAADQLDHDPDRALTPAQIALLRKPTFNGGGEGQALLYDYFLHRSMVPERDAALRAAADLGHPAAQRILAFEIIGKDGARASTARWLPLMREAAHGGDAMAARMMSADARDRKQWVEAAGWLLGAVDDGDQPSLYQLAELYEAGHPGVSGNLDDAVATYEELAADETDTDTGAKARRRLAALALEGRGMKRNPAHAREWLLVDAQREDSRSQVQLASAYFAGSFGKIDLAEGERWLKRAADNGSVEGRSTYGAWLVSRRGSAEAHARGSALLRAAAQDGDIEYLNNLAWYQCVSTFPDVRDPVAGLQSAKRMQRDQDSMTPSFLDTVAACYAASGDFATAATLQQQVVDSLADNREARAASGDRLALYRAGKPYYEAAQ